MDTDMVTNNHDEAEETSDDDDDLILFNSDIQTEKHHIPEMFMQKQDIYTTTPLQLMMHVRSLQKLQTMRPLFSTMFVPIYSYLHISTV